MLLPDIDEEDSEEVLSPTDIYEQLIGVGELILTIPADEESKLKKSLASAKNKANAKLKESGINPENNILTFVTTPSDEHQGYICVQVTLAKRSGIRVKKVEYPDPEF